MSKGPGRVQRALDDLFTRAAFEFLTTTSMCIAVFGVPRDEVTKRHRVAVLRALPSVLTRHRNWHERVGEGKPKLAGRDRIFVRVRPTKAQAQQERAQARREKARAQQERADRKTYGKDRFRRAFGDATVSRLLLDVPEGATTGEVERAFRARSKTLHPDKGGDAASFRALVEAREVLLTPPKL